MKLFQRAFLGGLGPRSNHREITTKRNPAMHTHQKEEQSSNNHVESINKTG